MNTSLCAAAVVLSMLALTSEAMFHFRRGSGLDRLWRHFPFRHHRSYGRQHGMGRFWPDFDFNLDFDYGHFVPKKDWWEGPNVCQSEETDNSTSSSEVSTVTHNFHTSTRICEESDAAYRCKTTLMTADGETTKTDIFQCCHGYTRKRRQFGCPEKLKLTDLVSTARKLELGEFLSAVDLVGLSEELTRGNFTVFAPVDGTYDMPEGTGFALSDTTDNNGFITVSKQVVEKVEHKVQDILLGHLLPEPRLASSFGDEDVVETASPVDSTIRINFYSRPEKLTTANCVRVLSTDNMASNGVIHTVEKMIPTVTATLMDLVQKDKQFSVLKKVLARAQLVPLLKEEGQLTLLAPTNAAFNSLDRDLLDRLLNGNPKCLEKVLKQHLLPNVMCSAVIQDRKAKTPNLLDHYVNLTRTEDGKLFVDDAQVVRADVMGTNGVMHIIDKILLPDDALDLVSVAKKNGLTELIRLVDKADLTATLRTTDNITVFAPSNEAIEALPEEVMQRMKSEPEFLQSVLQYHVVPEEHSCRSLYNNLLLDTLNEKDKVRINSNNNMFGLRARRGLTAQCANIVGRNIASCNGLIHIIDKVMLPPSGNVLDVMAADPKYSTLVKLIKNSGLADAMQEEGPFTVFAPTNEAFDGLGKETMKDLEENKELLTSLIMLHIVPRQLCCSRIYSRPRWYYDYILSAGNDFLSISHIRGQAYVSGAAIGSCDNVATNGVVHGIDSVLRPRDFFSFP